MLYKSLRKLGLDINIAFNIVLVNEGARSGAFFFNKEIKKLEKVLEKVEKLTPKLFYMLEKMGKFKYLYIMKKTNKSKFYDSKKERMKLKSAKSIGKFLDYTCPGELGGLSKNLLTISYIVNGTVFYTEVCHGLNPSKVKKIKKQYKAFEKVGKKYDLKVKLRVERWKGKPEMDEYS